MTVLKQKYNLFFSRYMLFHIITNVDLISTFISTVYSYASFIFC